MEIVLLLVALVALLVAGACWVSARSATTELTGVKQRLAAAERDRDELKDAQAKRQSKDQSRQTEVEELRERQKDLKRKLAESQDLAKRVKDVEAARREVEEDAHAAVQRARAEALTAQAESKALRAELDQLRFRRPAPRPESTDSAEPVAAEQPPTPPPVPLGPSAAEIALQAALQDAEAKLAGEKTRHAETHDRSQKEQKKVQDANRELERQRAKLATSEKLYMVQKGELEVWKDRYRTLEQRLNKSLREVDALQRGVLALEKRLPQSSVQAARDEVARLEAARQVAEEEARAKAEETRAGGDANEETGLAGDPSEPPEDRRGSPGVEPSSPPPSPESGEAGLEAKGSDPS
jgi:hypothetical protein